MLTEVKKAEKKKKFYNNILKRIYFYKLLTLKKIFSFTTLYGSFLVFNPSLFNIFRSTIDRGQLFCFSYDKKLKFFQFVYTELAIKAVFFAFKDFSVFLNFFDLFTLRSGGLFFFFTDRFRSFDYPYALKSLISGLLAKKKIFFIYKAFSSIINCLYTHVFSIFFNYSYFNFFIILKKCLYLFLIKLQLYKTN